MKHQQHFIFIFLFIGTSCARALNDVIHEAAPLQATSESNTKVGSGSDIALGHSATDGNKLFENKGIDLEKTHKNRTIHNENLDRKNAIGNGLVNNGFTKISISTDTLKQSLNTNSTDLGTNNGVQTSIVNPNESISTVLFNNQPSFAGATNTSGILNKSVSEVKSNSDHFSDSTIPRGDSDPLLSADDTETRPKELSGDEGRADSVHPNGSEDVIKADNVFPDGSEDAGRADNVYPDGSEDAGRADNLYPEESEETGLADNVYPDGSQDAGKADNVYPDGFQEAGRSDNVHPDGSHADGIVDNIYPESESSDEGMVNSHTNYSIGASSSSINKMLTLSTSTISWLDAFMYQYRDSYWIMFNTFFMVIWVLVGIFSLYRLFGLPWCSPYVSKTLYLVIHLLIFTAATFEFVQLVHLSYGSPEGLPLFLTLLLTHTPTPCLAASLILMIYCLFASARVPVVSNYLPPLLYVCILSSFIIVLSFVGDIIVGASRISIILIVTRLFLNSLCLACFLALVINYKKIIQVARLLRREFRGELKALAVPVNIHEENQDAKLHLKKFLITWTRITLVGCIAGVFMCLCSFSLSLFFTISYVPLWVFWVLHSSIFVSQIILVVCLTFGAALTLTYTNMHNIFYKFFIPSLPNQNISDESFIKHGNFIYQRVATSNGPSSSHRISALPVEVEDHNSVRNNNIITELTTPPFRTRVNLKRSATFNCAPPYGFQGVVQPSPTLYPVLSEHYLMCANSQNNSNFNNDELPDNCYNESRHLNYGHPSDYNHILPENREVHYREVGRYPMRGRFSSLRSIPYNSNRTRSQIMSKPASGNPPVANTGFVGTVHALEIPFQPINSVLVSPPESFPDHSFIRYNIPENHSFSSTPRSRNEAPEKPARKPEPVLVKGVMRDNANVEKTISGGKDFLLQPQESSPFLVRDPNVYNSDGKTFTVREKMFPILNTHSPYSKNIEPIVPSKYPLKYNVKVDLPEVSSISAPSPIDSNKSACSAATSGFSVRASNDYKNSPTIFPPFLKPMINSSSKPTKPNENLTNLSDSLQKRSSHNNESEASNFDTDHSNELAEVINHDNEQCLENGLEEVATESSSLHSNLPVDTENDSATLPSGKRRSLRRNHSTAGYLSSQDGENYCPELSKTNAKLKYPWYGTWGGRRPKRRVSSPNPETSSAQLGSKMNKLSSSKGSLSSLYGKLKPKRSKSMYQQTRVSKDEEPSGGMSDEADEGRSLDINFAHQEEESEEDEFLPRLDEDIDLASEILKSSTVLADFYSLKRSDLKNRRNANMEQKMECNDKIETENYKTERGEGREGIILETSNKDENT